MSNLAEHWKEFAYRPEIDGLRAVAVGLVLLFHAGLGFPGGYIGVDVFFVISGFLITSLMLKEHASKGSFSLAGFWMRRIKRILPAAAILVLLTLVAGYFLLLPEDYQKLGESSIWQQLMLANVFFWRDGGYFGTASELKPLLHTWSLAVEEQFYLFFPLLMAFLFKRTRAFAVTSLILISIVSFALCEYGSFKFSSATFYLLPTRAWELLVGALIAYFPDKRFKSATVNELLSAAGILTIFAGAWYLTSLSRFPGSSALIPCIGSALFIFANHEPTRSGKWLAHPYVVFVGLISYSLYLWHWPIFVFIRYWAGIDPPLQLKLTGLAASFIAGFISWRFVETPFRKSVKLTNHSFAIAQTIILLAIIVGASYLIRLNQGFPDRFDSEVQKVVKNNSNLMDYQGSSAGIKNDKLPIAGVESNRNIDFLVWGDSHAMALGSELDALAKESGLKGVIAARPATVPLLNAHRNSIKNPTVEKQWNKAVLEYISQNKIKVVILVARWAFYVEGHDIERLHDAPLIVNSDSTQVGRSEAQRVMRDELKLLLAKLKELGVTTKVMYQVPAQELEPKKVIAWSKLFGLSHPVGVHRQAHLKHQSSTRSVFEELFPAIDIIESDDVFFDEDDNSIIGEGSVSFYHDNNHLSNDGVSHFLRPSLNKLLNEVANIQSAESKPQ